MHWPSRISIDTLTCGAIRDSKTGSKKCTWITSSPPNTTKQAKKPCCFFFFFKREEMTTHKLWHGPLQGVSARQDFCAVWFTFLSEREASYSNSSCCMGRSSEPPAVNTAVVFLCHCCGLRPVLCEVPWELTCRTKRQLCPPIRVQTRPSILPDTSISHQFSDRFVFETLIFDQGYQFRWAL